jgi:hypothetical protein
VLKKFGVHPDRYVQCDCTLSLAFESSARGGTRSMQRRPVVVDCNSSQHDGTHLLRQIISYGIFLHNGTAGCRRHKAAERAKASSKKGPKRRFKVQERYKDFD